MKSVPIWKYCTAYRPASLLCDVIMNIVLPDFCNSDCLLRPCFNILKKTVFCLFVFVSSLPNSTSAQLERNRIDYIVENLKPPFIQSFVRVLLTFIPVTAAFA